MATPRKGKGMIKLKKEFATAKAWLIKHQVCAGGGFIVGFILGIIL
jgi:hypothetical protein